MTSSPLPLYFIHRSVSRMRSFQLLPIFLFSSICSFSQSSDYLVTSRNDTLRGKVRIISFDNDQGQVIQNGKKVVFPAYQIKAIQLDNAHYESQKRQGQYRIMKLLKSGYLSLYGYNEPNQSSFDFKFLVKKDGTSLDVPNLGFKKFLADYLADCEPVSSGIKSGLLGRKDLDKIIAQYNDCITNNTKQSFVQPTAATPAAPIINAKSNAADVLQKKVIDLPDFENKKNALDLINDIQSKIKKGESVPPYLVDGLKNYLLNKDQVKTELENFLSTLK